MYVVLVPICIVATLMVTANRVVPMKYIFGYATAIDVTFTVLIIGMFHGTLSGMVSATMAGLLLACFLTCGRNICGYSKLVVKDRVLVVQDYPAIWTLNKYWTIAFAIGRTMWRG